MARWTIDEPAGITLEKLSELRVRIVAGHIDVIATDDRPRLDVLDVEGPELLITEEDGVLTVTYEDLTWEGIMKWLRPRYKRRTALAVMVPPECRVELGVVSATAVIAGTTGGVTARGVAGDITLDGVSGETTVQTVSGDLEARDLSGRLNYGTVQGDLTIAGGTVEQLYAKTVNSKIMADVDLADHCRVRLSTLSGFITLRVPENPGAFVDLRSTSGGVSSAFDGMTRGDGPGSASLTGHVGEGTGSVTAVTVSGDVTLLRRDAPEAVTHKEN
jgi:hypothetical protein